jgi:hypothetical protein
MCCSEIAAKEDQKEIRKEERCISSLSVCRLMLNGNNGVDENRALISGLDLDLDLDFDAAAAAAGSWQGPWELDCLMANITHGQR